MSQLTENQNIVLNLISTGHNTAVAVAKASGFSKKVINPIFTELVDKDLIVNKDDGTFIPLLLNERIDSINDTAIKVNETYLEENESQLVNVVIPYLKSEAAGEELKYALRSWEKNFTENIRVIIIGDREDWFSPEIVYIPHEPHLITEVCNCPVPAQIRNPQADVTHKILTAITVENISGGFIITNDDIFLLGETTLADIETLKAFEQDLISTGLRKGLYAQNNRLAAKVLRDNGLPTIRYGTHTPMAFHAEKLLEVIEKYNATEHGYPLASLFYNEVYPNARPILIDGGVNDPILASAYRENIDKTILDKVFNTRKFLNCDNKGWLAIKPHLELVFPETSRFEH